MSMLKSGVCEMSSVKCLMLRLILGWDMLNNFCFHGFAKMSLFMAENDNEVFLTAEPSSVSGPIMELVPS